MCANPLSSYRIAGPTTLISALLPGSGRQPARTNCTNISVHLTAAGVPGVSESDAIELLMHSRMALPSSSFFYFLCLLSLRVLTGVSASFPYAPPWPGEHRLHASPRVAHPTSACASAWVIFRCASTQSACFPSAGASRGRRLRSLQRVRESDAPGLGIRHMFAVRPHSCCPCFSCAPASAPGTVITWCGFGISPTGNMIPSEAFVLQAAANRTVVSKWFCACVGDCTSGCDVLRCVCCAVRKYVRYPS